MRRFFGGCTLILAMLALGTPRSAEAQAVFLGAGATIPMSDYGDLANTGWMGFGGVLFPVGASGQVSVGAEGFYGSNSHSDVDGDKTNLYGALALVGLALGDDLSSVRPTFFGGLGYMTHAYKSEQFPTAEGSESALAGAAGLALSFPLGSMGGLVAGSYHFGLGDLDTTQWIGISAAVQIPVGGS